MLLQGGFQAEFLSKINAIRSKQGLPGLQYNQAMDAAAARHSYDMSGKRSLSHTGRSGLRAAHICKCACISPVARRHTHFPLLCHAHNLPPLLVPTALLCLCVSLLSFLPPLPPCLCAGTDGSQFNDRLRVAGGGGFKCSGENVAETGSNGSPDTVVSMWMGSPGHRDNMMRRDYTHVGVAKASNGGRTFWTLVLGGCGK